jgi:hypothetical protein
MEKMNLMHIAREANRGGDAKTLFHALDLLERLMSIAPGRVDAFMAFCAELETEGNGWKARLPCWHGWSWLTDEIRNKEERHNQGHD